MRRLRLLLLPTLLLAAMALAPATASAKTYNIRVGIGDQRTRMFDNPAFQALKIRQVRYFIPWNAMRHRDVRLAARAFVKKARANGARVLLHVSTDDYAIKHGHLPSQGQYKHEIGRMVRYFRKLGVRDFGAWNEANHKSQPTWNHPKSAAGYFKEMRRAVFKGCSSRHCRVVGLDVLDQAGVSRYIGRFIHYVGRRYASKYLRIVGIHNYSDVNRKRTRGLRNIIHAVHLYTHRPNFWLTETGGVVEFGRSFPCSQTRAAHRLDYLFDTMRRYRSQIQRVFLYNWTGADCAVRFDAGLVNSDGSPRKGYYTVKRRIVDFKR